MLHKSIEFQKFGKVILESDTGKALLACDDNGPTIMMCVNMTIDPAAGPVAIGRLFSGNHKRWSNN